MESPTRQWRLVGVFDNEAAMNEARRCQKVAKHDTRWQLHGTKVIYRCNSWKRTHCAFKMFARHRPDGSFELYSTGQHVHPAGPTRGYRRRETITNAGNVRASSPDLAEMAQGKHDLLHLLMEMAKAFEKDQQERLIEQENMKMEAALDRGAPSGELSLREDADDPAVASPRGRLFPRSVNQSRQTPISTVTNFRLHDRDSLVQLLQVTAAELGVSFHEHAPGEYLLTSPCSPLTLLFSDLDSQVRVCERVPPGQTQNCEFWTKTDWLQFHWAVKGKCMQCLR